MEKKKKDQIVGSENVLMPEICDFTWEWKIYSLSQLSFLFLSFSSEVRTERQTVKYLTHYSEMNIAQNYMLEVDL